MTLPTQAINGKDLARFASDKLHVWSDLVGRKVTHVELGSGEILSVEQRPNYIPLIRIKFGNEASLFNSDSFLDGKSSVLVDVGLAKRVEEWLRALADEKANKEQIKKYKNRILKEFAPLVRKYNTQDYLLLENNEISPLGPILKKLECHKQLDAQELDWLEHKQQNNLLATIYFRNYKENDDQWLLVKACKFLRKAGLPEKVLSITSDVSSSNTRDKKVLSALLTTRGGALRDLNNIEEAKKSALDAIRISPMSFHPHNLMGAILYEEGSFIEGDKYFDESDRLGSNPRDHKIEIQRMLSRSTTEARNKIIKFLLSKDSKKYSWVVTD
ncbi:MAG: hypothetical protein RBS99_14725 [Rhodospirillales bacterium]|jgi:tetratricopeptide (TPR) repeat protein|nr:hypothetical protein [Rhodospirillales bacterium]